MNMSPALIFHIKQNNAMTCTSRCCVQSVLTLNARSTPGQNVIFALANGLPFIR